MYFSHRVVLAIALANVGLLNAAPTSPPIPNVLEQAIHPQTLCCKNSGIPPLPQITTLDACVQYCARQNLKPLDLGNNKYACQRPQYACDSVGQGAECAACYQAGLCYLIPYEGGVFASNSVDLSKLTRKKQSSNQREVDEAGQGERLTGIGGIGKLQTFKKGSESELNLGKEVVLSQQKRSQISTDNFSAEDLPENLPPGVTAEDLKRLGTSGTISQTQLQQRANDKNVRERKSNTSTGKSESFHQHVGALGHGASGKFNSNGVDRLTSVEEGRDVSEGQRVSNRHITQLTGTAAGGKGNVEISKENIGYAKRNQGSLTRETSGKGVIGQSLELKHGKGDLSVTLTGKKSNQGSTTISNKGTSNGNIDRQQIASNEGLSFTTQEKDRSANSRVTQSSNSGSYNTQLNQKKGCKHCKSSKYVNTSGQFSGQRAEVLDSANEKNRATSLHGVAGKGAYRSVSESNGGAFKRNSKERKNSSEQVKYGGANANLGLTGSYRGTVDGSSKSQSNSLVQEEEQGFSKDDFHAFTKHSFPSKVHH